jgi:hypothetical protein
MSEESTSEVESGPARPGKRGTTLSSRALVIGLFGWIVLFGAGALWVSMRIPDGAELRESPFKLWDGIWEGEVEIFGEDGVRQAHVRVRREFRHVASDDQFRQEGQFRVTDVETGEEKQEKGLHSAEFDRTNLARKVFKEKGSVMEVFTGEQDERGAITWRREIPGLKESYREWLEGDAGYLEGKAEFSDPLTTRTLIYRGVYRRAE